MWGVLLPLDFPLILLYRSKQYSLFASSSQGEAVGLTQRATKASQQATSHGPIFQSGGFL
jgi:hypothetical protein